MTTTTTTSVYVSSINVIKEEVDISDDEIVPEEVVGEEGEGGNEEEPYLGERLFELPDFDAAEPEIPDYDPLGTDYDISVEEDENAIETGNDTVVQTLMELVDEQQSLVEESQDHGIIEVYVESDSDDDVVELEQEEEDQPLIITSVQTLKKEHFAGFPSTDLKVATFQNLDIFRCFICRKDFNTFNDFLAHRTTMKVKAHTGVEFDSEREKPFLCGICQKPWNQPRKALACAVYGHDAAKLHECMFMQRCPHCPETHLGFHSLAAVGRHWMLTHPDKKLPQFLSKSGGKDILPSIKVGEKQASLVTDAMVQANPKLVLENPDSSQPAVNNGNVASSKPKSLLKVYKCADCQRNFETRREVEVHQCLTNESRVSLKVPTTKALKFVCDDCGREFSNGRNLRMHLLRAGTCKKFEGQNPSEFPYKCIFCGTRHPSWKSYIVHRSKSHATVPYNPAMELPFACRICQKPALVEKQAIICGLFGHRPDTLVKEMFKYKCTQCTTFGFHSTFALRRHWEQDHRGLPIPENLQTPVDKPLPTVQITLEQLLSVTRMRLHSSGLVMERALQAPHTGQRTPNAFASARNFVINKEVMPLLKNGTSSVPMTSPVVMSVKPRVEKLFVSTLNSAPIPEKAMQPEIPNSDEKVKEESVEKVMCLTCGESFKDIRRHMRTHDESRFMGQPKHKCWCGKVYHLRNSLYSHWKKNKHCKLKFYEKKQLEGKDVSTNGTLIQLDLDSAESGTSAQIKTQATREYILKIPSPQHSPVAGGSSITTECTEQKISLLDQLENATSNNVPSKVPGKEIDLYAAFAKLDDTAPAVEPIDFDNFIHLDFEEVKDDEIGDIPEVVDVPVPFDSANVAMEPKKIRPSICLICNTGFPTQFMFMKHMAMVHKDVFRYNCNHCGKGFKKLDQLKVHETIHDPNRFSGEPSFACDQCDQKYHLKISLESHRKIKHLGYQKPQSRAHLPVIQHRAIGVKRISEQSQQRDTTGSRSQPKVKSCDKTSYSCSICPRTFARPFLLEQHKLLHTGEKPHKCDQCGKSFRLRKSLNVHQLSHESKTSRKLDNTYKCFICGLHEFRNLQALEKHRLKQHISIPYFREKEKPFGCGVCQKPYLLRSHAMVCAILGHDPTSLQTAMFKYKCPECPEDRLGYHSLTSLRDHLVEEHPDFSIPGKLLPNQYQVDKLPRVTINKQKAEEIKENGPQEVYDFPLVIEFDLLQPRSGSDTPEDSMPSLTKSESFSDCSKLVVEDEDLSLSTEISREDALEAVKALVLHRPRSNSMPRLTPQKSLPPTRSPSKRKSNQMANQYGEGSVAEDRALGNKRIAGIIERNRIARLKKSKLNYKE